MDDLHVPSVPKSGELSNGQAESYDLEELSAQKERLESELSALGSVLDSVRSIFSVIVTS